MEIFHIEGTGGFFIQACSPIIPIKIDRKFVYIFLATELANQFLHDGIIHVLIEVTLEEHVIIVIKHTFAGLGGVVKEKQFLH